MTELNKRNFKSTVSESLFNRFGVTPESANPEQIYEAMAVAVRETLSSKYRRYLAKSYGEGGKRVYYMCIEYLIGRSLKNNLYNLGLEDQAAQYAADCGLPLERIFDEEPDAGLGNGGLGRLAACYLDGLATCDYPAGGYSILYEFGIFKQAIIDGWQQEMPDNWLPGGKVWLEEHASETVEVRFGGEIHEEWYHNFHHVTHTGGTVVLAVPYDLYISGYQSAAVSRLRLWKSVSPGIDMESFNKGDYAAAMLKTNSAELISKVLYPNDDQMDGKILRLRQQYFLCSASISDLVHRHLEQYGTLENLPDKVAIHINDTHPTLAIPEMMRIMLDECGYEWDKAFELVTRTFAFTNHTILSEALECWNEDMFKTELPRIYQILQEMDRRLAASLFSHFPGDTGKVNWMRIIHDHSIRMANICVSVCHAINGVSALHSEIIKQSLFHDYYLYTPEKFTNVTNGIAYRRWLLQSNPLLTELLSQTIGDGFKKNAMELRRLEKFVEDDTVLDRLAEIKYQNKCRLAQYIEKTEGDVIDPCSIFDVQAKRLHEYKRQHLNALHILRQYLDLKQHPSKKVLPHTYIFGAKAASGYFMAKQIIRLICAIKQLIESDPRISKMLRVVYLEDYRVTVSELLMPASEVSEQISLAGKEASGTSNMKFMLNGALTLGTLDGANIEIREAAGEDNFVLFGMSKEEVAARRQSGYSPARILETNRRLKEVIDFIDGGFCGKTFGDIVRNLTQEDPYMVLADFDSYCAAQSRIEILYADTRRWNQLSLMNIAGAGIFSADRAITEYADKIWDIKPVH